MDFNNAVFYNGSEDSTRYTKHIILDFNGLDVLFNWMVSDSSLSVPFQTVDMYSEEVYFGLEFLFFKQNIFFIFLELSF